MIVRQSLLDVEPMPRAVAIGSFDGVHRGHQTVIGSAVQAGAARDLRSAVVTFHPHPLEVLRRSWRRPSCRRSRARPRSSRSSAPTS